MRDRLKLACAFKAGIVFVFNTDLFDPKWRIGDPGAVFVDIGRSRRPERAACAAFYRRHYRNRSGLWKAPRAAKTRRIEWPSY